MNIVHCSLKHFSQGSIKAIQRFCNQVNHSDADVFILMARKSVCFLKHLGQIGMIWQEVFQRLVVTDTSFDFPWESLHGKRITIIDDILVSGTSIAKMINRLLDGGISASDIDVIILAYDKKYSVVDFTDPETGKVFFNREATDSFEDPECIKLSNDIAQMIAFSGNTFNIDFPEYTSFLIDAQAFNALFDKSMWNIYEVTNVYHKKGDNFSYTFLPKSNIVDLISHKIGCDIRAFTQFKIRVIAHKCNKNKYSCLLVPLTIMGQISSETLHNIWDQILGDYAGHSLGKFEWSDAALFRMIQFLVAKVLMDTFVSLANLSKYTLFDASCIPLLFGYDSAGLIEEFVKHLENTHIRRDTCPKKFYSDGISVAKNYDRVNKGQGAFDINARLLEPFSFWYWGKEIPVREQIVSYAEEHGGINFRRDFSALEHIDESNRLNNGFSFDHLCQTLSDMEEFYDVPSVVSIFLDRAVDMGVIVPINEVNSGSACRCYRHGEDFPFSKADESKLLYFLQNLYKQIEDVYINKVNFEKMLVLFMQLAKKDAQRPIFDEFQGFDNHELLTVKYCVHGAVLVNVKQDVSIDMLHPYSEKNSYCPWLRETLEDKKTIIEEKIPGTNWSGIRIDETAIANQIDESVLTDIVEPQIQLFANVIGRWYTLYKNKPFNHSERELLSGDEDEKLGTPAFRRDITTLTSCYSLESLAGSELAEIHYCLLDLKETITKKLLVQTDSEIRIGDDFDLYFGQEMNSRDENRTYKTNAYLAMYNGIMKAKEFYSGGADKVIQRVQTCFRENNSDSTLESLWKMYWSGRTSEKEPLNQDLQKWVLECITYLYIFYISYTELHNLCVMGVVSSVNPGSSGLIEVQWIREQYDTDILQRAKDSNVSNKLIHLVHNLCTEKSFQHKDLITKKLSICKQLMDLEPQITKTCQDIESYIAEKSLQYVRMYSFCTLFIVPKAKQHRVQLLLKRNLSPNTPIIKDESCIVEGKSQFCVYAASEREQDELIEAFDIPDVQIIILHDLPRSLSAKYNIRGDAKALWEQFRQNVLNILIKENSAYCVASSHELGKGQVGKYCGVFSLADQQIDVLDEKEVTILDETLYITCFGKSKSQKKEENHTMDGAKYNIGSAGQVIISEGSNNTIAQNQINGQDTDIDYEAIHRAIKEIKKYQISFAEVFGDRADEATQAISNAEDGIKQKDSSKTKSALKVLKELAMGAGGSLIAQGILSLMSNLAL